MTTPKIATPGGSGQANADQKTASICIFADVDAARNAYLKITRTAIANAALAGLVVYEWSDGSFVVSSWGFITPVADLAGVMRMVRRIGGAT